MKNPVRRKWMIVGGVLVLAALTVFVLFAFIKAPVRTKDEAIAVCTRIIDAPHAFGADGFDVTASDWDDEWFVRFMDKNTSSGMLDGSVVVKVSKQDRTKYEIIHR